jgi:hypothetical protein
MKGQLKSSIFCALLSAFAINVAQAADAPPWACPINPPGTLAPDITVAQSSPD